MSPVLLETWLPVVGWSAYDVSDVGRVRRRATGRFLRLRQKRDGHLDVNLCQNGIQVKRLVHHLVLEAFAGPCPVGMEAMHGGSGPNCNWWPLNIRWGTRSDNMRDRFKAGWDLSGERNPNYRHGLTVGGIDNRDRRAYMREYNKRKAV